MKRTLMCTMLAVCVLGMIGCGDSAEFKRTRQAAEQGDVEAQSKLGYMYAEGWGVAEDQAEAVKWYIKAAEQGDYSAKNELERIKRNSEGLARDDAGSAATPMPGTGDTGSDTATADGGYVPEEKPTLDEDAPFLEIEMVYVEAGEFRMGSSLSAQEVRQRYGKAGTKQSYGENEHPQHTVRISRDFWMGQYEVTNAEFRQFVNATGHRTDAEQEGWAIGRRVDGKNWAWGEVDGVNWRNPGWRIEDGQPVVCVSWNDAQAFVRWLNEKSGHTYRLPTEAEWEYACRAGTTGPYQWGHEAGSAEGWLNAADQTKSPEGGGWNSPSDFSDGYFFPAPVGRFRANAWGLYDMHGNVWEWCQDRYAEKYPSGSVTDPTGPSSGSSRVNRGGSWNDFLASCRSAPRSGRSQGFRIAVLGFRVCRDADK